MEKKVVISFKAAQYEKMYSNFYKDQRNKALGFFNKHDIVKNKSAKIV